MNPILELQTLCGQETWDCFTSALCAATTADVPNLASFTNPSDDYNPKLSDGNVYECDRLNTRRLELAPWPSRSEGCWPRSGSQLTGDDAITMCERRRSQNRQAQRAFRRRKVEYLKDLELKLAELRQKYWSLETNHAELSVAFRQMDELMKILNSTSMSECEAQNT